MSIIVVGYSWLLPSLTAGTPLDTHAAPRISLPGGGGSEFSGEGGRVLVPDWTDRLLRGSARFVLALREAFL